MVDKTNPLLPEIGCPSILPEPASKRSPVHSEVDGVHLASRQSGVGKARQIVFSQYDNSSTNILHDHPHCS